MKAKNGSGQGYGYESTDSRKADNFLTTWETIKFTRKTAHWS
jgi:hypothetical protein